jgi:transcriptional regulator with XRE-family HTH domain
MDGRSVVQTTIGERCALARSAAGISQEEMVEELRRRGRKASVRALIDWERPEGEKGQRDPPSWFVADVAEVTGEDSGLLVSGVRSPAHAKLEKIRAILDRPPNEPAEDEDDGTRGVVDAVGPPTEGGGEGLGDGQRSA